MCVDIKWTHVSQALFSRDGGLWATLLTICERESIGPHALVVEALGQH